VGELLRRLYKTNFQGNLRTFFNEIELKQLVISNKLELDGNPNELILYTEAMFRTTKNLIQRKLPDRIFMTLARSDISTVLKLKQAAQQEGLYEENENLKHYNINVNKIQKQQQTIYTRNPYPYTNLHNTQPALSIQPHPNQPQRMVPQNYRFQSNNRNNTFDQNRGSYQEFRRNLIQGQQNNTMNQSQQPSGLSGSVPNQSQVRVRESNSGQSRTQVDENYQQNKEYKEVDVYDENENFPMQASDQLHT